MKKIIIKLINWIEKVSKDKLLHFIAGSLITEITTILWFAIFKSSYGGAIFGLIVGLASGAIKEYFDETNSNSVCSLKDAFATATGAILEFLLIIILLL